MNALQRVPDAGPEAAPEPVRVPQGDGQPGSRIGLLSWPGLLCLLALMGGAAWLGYDAVVLVAGLIVATGLVGRTWAALSLRGLGYHRELSTLRAFPGETVTLAMTLDNRKPLPLGWVRAEERVPAALAPLDEADDPSGGTTRPVGFATALGWYQTATWRRELVCRRRGYHPIGPATLLSGDVFGLFLDSRRAAPAQPVIVYPRLVDLPDLGLPSRQPLGEARDPARLFQDPSRLAGLRAYTPETPFRHIAWKASARQGGLQAKVFDPTVTLRTALFLAVDAFDAKAEEALFELAISAVASLADRLLEQREPVGLFANGTQADGSGPIALPPGRGDDQRVLILEALAKLESRVTTPLAAFLDDHAGALPPGTTLCAVGARLDQGALHRLAMLRRRGYGAVGLIVGSGPLPGGPVPCRRVEVQQQGEWR